MSCESCIKAVSKSLYELPGIVKVNADLQSQLVSVEGNAAPSSIVKSIQSTGRDAILRGSGTADSGWPAQYMLLGLGWLTLIKVLRCAFWKPIRNR